MLTLLIIIKRKEKKIKLIKDKKLNYLLIIMFYLMVFIISL